jgi:hypothetical protein
MEAHNGDLEAQNWALEGLMARVRQTPITISEEQDPNLDPH